ncbi:hypothetical protein [Sinomicrobium sp. M5D2P9]
MKTQFITYSLILLFSICFISCSNDDNNTPENPGSQLSDDAVLYEFDNQSFKDSLSLELVLPEAKTDSTKTDSRIFLTFYNPSDEGVDQWYPVPGVRQDKNYKIYNEYEKDSSNPELVKFKIIAEQSKNSESYEKTLNYKKLKVIAIKPEAIRNITPADLDFKDFFAVMNYFGLDKE